MSPLTSSHGHAGPCREGCAWHGSLLDPGPARCSSRAPASHHRDFYLLWTWWVPAPHHSHTGHLLWALPGDVGRGMHFPPTSVTISIHGPTASAGCSQPTMFTDEPSLGMGELGRGSDGCQQSLGAWGTGQVLAPSPRLQGTVPAKGPLWDTGTCFERTAQFFPEKLGLKPGSLRL